ncbi:hypothetical protein PGT21_031586 [Puccinia graminis f. sp. tritici]|uniref:GYF domain-containing protein n=1 Tax=Puccinia graminis f. sp. tritici TaxID=56615 RepID=A0A5B0M7X2_PUCGR|nr:hypothetical protein PGT21_031586 [Puccinia graminis f. sp. tritici]KAA1086310.1 hypothetical protein PGTUg99_009357 [Puccinia graminis f. sp. tritici]
MANKRSLDPPLDQSPSSLNQAKKVKFGTLPPNSGSSKARNKKAASSSSTFEPIDDSTDLQFDELNQVGKIKKGNVKVDGYDSDSSTENTEVRSGKKKKKESKDEMDEDDIFGDEKEADGDGRKDKPKFEKIDVGLKVKKGAEAKDFLDLGDIEGQEFGKEEEEELEDEEDEEDEDGGGGGKKKNRARNQQPEEDDSANDYSEEEEDFVPGDEFANADDAPRARRKSKKGMGFLLSKFNMAEELQEGRMAADGSYVASAKDPEAVHDNWLEGVNSKKTIKQARDAKRLRDEQLRSKVEKEESMASLRTRKECYIALLGLLPVGDGRTVSQILCHLGNEKRALQGTEKKPKKKVPVRKSAIDSLVSDRMEVDEESKTNNGDHRERSADGKPEEENRSTSQQTKSEEEVKLDRRIGEITDLASMLMGTHGELDIYEMSHGSITGILKSEGLVPRDWVPPSSQDISITSSSGVQSDTSQPARKSLISRPSIASALAQPPQIYYKFIHSSPPTSNPSESEAPVYGPFDKSTMLSWAQQGFFGHDFERILVKLDSSLTGNATWGPWNQIFNH